MDDVKEMLNATEEQFRPRQYRFYPNKDITAFELALILGIINFQVDETIYKKFPPIVQKHFDWVGREDSVVLDTQAKNAKDN